MLGDKTAEWWAIHVLVIVAVLVGLFELGSATTWVAAGAVAVPCVLLAWSKFDEVAGRVVGASLVAAVGLIGVNWAVDKVFSRLPIVLGLLFAVDVFFLFAFSYLRRACWPPLWAAVVASALAQSLVIAAPVVVGLADRKKEDVAQLHAVASRLDVLIVTDGKRRPNPRELPPDPVLNGFDVSYSVGYAAGDAVRWTRVDEPSAAAALRIAAMGDRAPVLAGRRPAAREDADRVLALFVDGTPPETRPAAGLPDVASKPGEVERWARVARDAAGRGGLPTFALLQTTRRRRLERWEHFVRSGDVVSVQALGSASATDAAGRLAIGAPTSDADLSLAMQHRPVLLFDTSETVPLPLSVGWMFGNDKVKQCDDRRVRTGCSPIREARQLENGGTHLRLTLPASKVLRSMAERTRRVELAAASGGPGGARRRPELPADAPGAPPASTPPPGAPGPGVRLGARAPPAGRPRPESAIYVHPVPVERDGRSLLYLDYWWYLPDNPAGVAGGAACGAGLVIPGITCHDHESDWEGLTVVVDRTDPTPDVTAVQYAQHDAVVRYEWSYLRRAWARDPRVKPLVATIADASERPLAFSASGTHATYPTPCPPGPCHQVAAKLGEQPHDGGLGWSGNDTAACGKRGCLLMVPTHEGGHLPALWNGYEGLWGSRHCALTFYCDSTDPPAAPGSQDRYKHPTQYDGTYDAEGFHRHPFEL